MSTAGFFSRSELGRALYVYRRELAWVAVFSLFANLLLLTPTLYLLQVYDRVLSSGSRYTLGALTLIMVLFFLVMGFAEWIRSRLLVRAGSRFDVAMHPRVFHANFEAVLSGNNTGRALQGFNDLTTLRQFITGNGAFALVDTPWTIVYIAVLFMMHAWLGWMAVGFTVVMLAIAVIGQRMTMRDLEKAGEVQQESTTYLHNKLRNAETVEALGMLGHLRRHWLAIHDRVLGTSATAQERTWDPLESTCRHASLSIL